jgi:sulfur-oxidizing protein SoxA
MKQKLLLGTVVTAILLSSLSHGEERPVPEPDLRSGYRFLSQDLRELQDDELANPGLLWVEQGADLWQQPAGASRQACSDCHDATADSMKGVATHYPVYDPGTKQLIDLEQRINLCRTQQQQAEALEYESEDLLSLTAFIAYQSRGLLLQVKVDGPAKPFFERGDQLYNRRIGQMNLACSHCHNQNWGKQLFSETISQGQPNAYPVYRLEWQTLGSLQRRLRSCNSGVRAELKPYGDADYIALELYLAWRGTGLPVETPGVRR